MSNELNDQTGLLPEPDFGETVHVMMRGSSSDRPWWRRLLPPSLCSLCFHLFFLSLVAVVTVTFADEILTSAAWEPETYASDYTIDNSLDYALNSIERDVPIKDVDELPPPIPIKDKDPDPKDMPPEKAGQGPPRIQPFQVEKLVMKPSKLIGDDGNTEISVDTERQVCPSCSRWK